MEVLLYVAMNRFQIETRPKKSDGVLTLSP